MPELQKRLDALALRLDRMGLQVAGALDHALRAVAEQDVQAGEQVDREDSIIDQEEVEIEKECINLLALYQPAAVDLRRICCIIKINNDLERIADIAARIARRVRHIVSGGIPLRECPSYEPLVEATRDIMGLTVRTLHATDTDSTRRIIAADCQLDRAYAAFTREVLDAARQTMDVDGALTLVLLARSLERVGDHCTNIAEDMLYLLTGNIVRHSASLWLHCQPQG